MRKLSPIAATALAIAGLGFIGYGLVQPAKAWLSVQLLDRAFERALAGEANVRPWPWMDSEPVARLSFPKASEPASGEAQRFVVMRGVSGSILAFAPGWHEGTARPGENGTTLISAHRDTHFALLKGIGLDDRLMLEDLAGNKRTYAVVDMIVTASPTIGVPTLAPRPQLLLVTCYPLDEWRANSRQRLVVVAEEV